MLRQRIAGDGPSAGVWLFQESDSPVESNEPADAEVAELADAPALGAGGRKAVGVRVPSSAEKFEEATRRGWLTRDNVFPILEIHLRSMPAALPCQGSRIGTSERRIGPGITVRTP